MKIAFLFIHVLTLFLLIGFETKAQTPETILANYTEKTGGQEKWDAVTAMEVTGKVKIVAQNMELPFLRILMKDGRQYTELTINGMKYISTAYDGNMVWGSDAYMKLEQKDSTEKEKVIQEKKKFPYPAHNWKEKGFKAELIGMDTINDSEVYKIKLIQGEQIVDGEPVESYSMLYIDTKSYLLVLTETPVVEGDNKGQMMQTYLSDYREVQGYWYPFHSELKYDGETAQLFITEEVKFNTEIDENIFKMPILTDE